MVAYSSCSYTLLVHPNLFKFGLVSMSKLNETIFLSTIIGHDLMVLGKLTYLVFIDRHLCDCESVIKVFAEIFIQE